MKDFERLLAILRLKLADWKFEDIDSHLFGETPKDWKGKYSWNYLNARAHLILDVLPYSAILRYVEAKERHEAS